MIAHYQLAHSIAPNISPCRFLTPPNDRIDIRYALYFRVSAHQLDAFYPESMIDIWKDFKGMTEVVKKEKKSFSYAKITDGVDKMKPGTMVSIVTQRIRR